MHWRRLPAVGLAVLVVVGLMLAFVTTAAGVDNGPGDGKFRSKLIGFHEAPAISTQRHGDFEIRLTSPSMLEFQLRYFDLEGGPATAAHIHFGQIGVAGGVSAFLCGGGGKPACPATTSATVIGTIVPADVIGPVAQGISAGEFAELIRAMRAGFTYANVHNAMFPSGQIRGQILD